MAQLKRPLSEPTSEDDSSQSEKPTARRATVYDAVAGKVTQSGFLGSKTFEQRRANQPLRPDEVLFKQARAPTRFEESDYYFAHKSLPPSQRLPSGELLEALHAYVSKLYSRTQESRDQTAWKCMDETALIALGILMEEAVKEVLGETGDLALLEAARSDEERALAGGVEEETRRSTRKGSERLESEARYGEGHRSEIRPPDDSPLYATEESE